MQDRKFTFKNRPSGYFGSVLMDWRLPQDGLLVLGLF